MIQARPYLRLHGPLILFAEFFWLQPPWLQKMQTCPLTHSTGLGHPGPRVEYLPLRPNTTWATSQVVGMYSMKTSRSFADFDQCTPVKLPRNPCTSMSTKSLRASLMGGGRGNCWDVNDEAVGSSNLNPSLVTRHTRRRPRPSNLRSYEQGLKLKPQSKAFPSPIETTRFSTGVLHAE